MTPWKKDPPFVLIIKKMQELAIRITRLQAAEKARRTAAIIRAHQPINNVKAHSDV